MDPAARDALRNMLASAVLVAMAALGATRPALGAPVFTPLGHLPGGRFPSWAEAVSADGSVVVGNSRMGAAVEAFRWTEAGGMVGLGGLPGGPPVSVAYDVSADGQFVVGYADTETSREAFLWIPPVHMVGLGYLLPFGWPESFAHGVSADGSVVVGAAGFYDPFVLQAFRWSWSTGMVGLGILGTTPGWEPLSRALAVSSDGSVVVGLTSSAPGGQAFLWTEAEGMVGLGDLPGGSFSSCANDISSDASVVVGSCNSSAGQEAFRWTEAEGMVGLGDLPGGDFLSTASAVSGDGSVVVGGSQTISGLEAFTWTAETGMRNLRSALVTEHGMDLSGWILTAAHDVSEDGSTIVGSGRNPDGVPEAWVLTGFDAHCVIPEPATLGLLLLGVLGLRWRQQARTRSTSAP